MDHIKPCLEYDSVWYKPGQYHRERMQNKAYFIKYRKFLRGFLDRVKNHLRKNNVKFKIVKDYNLPTEKPVKQKLKNIIFRPYQDNLINSAVSKKRGVIVSATASGKTILQAGIISRFKKSKILLLCDTVDIIQQTKLEFDKFDFDSYIINTGKDKEWLNKRIVLSTIQTAVRLNVNDYIDYFDIIIIDETHKCSSIEKNVKNKKSGETKKQKSLYAKFLLSSLAEIRLGFTATLPRTKVQKLSLEGLLGPVIETYKVSKGVKEGYLAKPIIKLLAVPETITGYKSYKDIHLYCLVQNEDRNNLIVSYVKKNIRRKRTSLIVIEKINHGDLILEIFKKKGIKGVIFIQGKTSKENRLKIKQALEDKKTKCVICTSIWREGINIKSLDGIINGAGGKSEVAVVQIAGRGLRITPEKDTVEIVDFLDPYKYLSQHCVLRLQTYVKNGWM